MPLDAVKSVVGDILLLLWQMGFSLSVMVRVGQRISANVTLKGETELVQPGVLP